MTERFILDENIVILAQKFENERGEIDPTSRQLIDNIIRICHTIVYDPLLWEKHFEQLKALPSDQPFGPRSLLRQLIAAQQTDGKIEILSTNAAEFLEERDIPQGSQDDVPMVRLAVETGVTLITTDTPLREDLSSSGVQEKYNLRVLSPVEALESL